MLKTGRHMLKMNRCHIVSTIYEASPLEKAWSENVKSWASANRTESEFCSQLSKNMSEINRISDLVSHMMTASTSNDPVSRHQPSQPPHDQRSLLSHFHHKMDCGILGERTASTSIEPLIGSLRHPAFPCPNHDKLPDKSYLLLASSQEKPHNVFESSSASSGPPRVIIFDLGASTYSAGLGGASQQWFVDTLKSRGFDVDEYYGWEVTQMSDKDILDPVPKELWPHYHYFNIPAPTGIDDLANPLNMLKAVSKPSDYVLLKLDIDNSIVEMEFVRQLLNSTELHSLVDEFFFEHHVNFQPMNGYWGTQNEPEELPDSYEIFGSLRNVGIRAHGWV